MIPTPSDVRVWLAIGRTDMRRGMNGLALQAQEALQRDPHVGDLFVFRGARGDLIKILWHDGLGLSLYAKRLERAGSFGRQAWHHHRLSRARRKSWRSRFRPPSLRICCPGSTGAIQCRRSGHSVRDNVPARTFCAGDAGRFVIRFESWTTHPATFPTTSQR